MILYTNALEYWRIAKRYHANRQFKGMRPVAVSDMMKLLPSTRGEATKRRIRSFIDRHSTQPPRSTPPLRTA